MIVRESHTGALKYKQGLLERHTGCKHCSFYGKITRGQREKGVKRAKEVKDMDKVKSTERRKKELGEAGLFVYHLSNTEVIALHKA